MVDRGWVMSNGWSFYVIAIVVLNIAGCVWLLLANRKTTIDESKVGKPLDHDFDGIQELNNPLPAWWSWLFWVTILFAIVYLIAYPGFGNLPGAAGWSSTAQWDAEMAAAQARYGPIYDGYMKMEIPDLLGEQQAIDMGSRLFANTCATCHGSDARGGGGYPNLTDKDWLWGGAPKTIVQTITHGRTGVMPPLGDGIGGEQGILEMAQYVISLSGREHDEAAAARAQPYFAQICSVCHGPTGTGNPGMGAPNLTDNIWLHGGRVSDIEYQIRNGRINQMPPHAAILSEEKIHLLALYVYSLSHEAERSEP